MKKNYFSLFSQFPLIEFINMKGPVIFLKVGDRQIQVIDAKRVQGKFWHNDLGLFELDGEYEGKLMGTPFYIYNLNNSKPISLKHIEKIQNMYRENKADDIIKELGRVQGACEKMENSYVNPLTALSELVKGSTDKKLFDLDDLKFLINYKTFDKSALKIFQFTKMMQKRTEGDTSRKVPTLVPLLLLSLLGVGVVVTMRFFNPFKLFPDLFHIFLGGLGLG